MKTYRYVLMILVTGFFTYVAPTVSAKQNLWNEALGSTMDGVLFDASLLGKYSGAFSLHPNGDLKAGPITIVSRGNRDLWEKVEAILKQYGDKGYVKSGGQTDECLSSNLDHYSLRVQNEIDENSDLKRSFKTPGPHSISDLKAKAGIYKAFVRVSTDGRYSLSRRLSVAISHDISSAYCPIIESNEAGRAILNLIAEYRLECVDRSAAYEERCTLETDIPATTE